MPDLTLHPGALQVASAYPDPPFEVGDGTGFDVELMRQLCQALRLEWRPVRYQGDDFNGIFRGLADRSYDAVISGTTITPEREQWALFSAPYLKFNQALVASAARTPPVRSVADLHGQPVGIQIGNTSDLVARRLLGQGVISAIRYYPYHGILAALDDLVAGKIAGVIKLFPVATWLVKDRPDLAVVQQIPTHEQLGIAFARANPGLCAAVNQALADLQASGRFDTLRRRWFGEPQ